jgi:hypothetical protein
MKLPRRNFQDLAAGAAALPRKPIRHGRCASSSHSLPAERPTLPPVGKKKPCALRARHPRRDYVLAIDRPLVPEDVERIHRREYIRRICARVRAGDEKSPGLAAGALSRSEERAAQNTKE